MPLRSEQVAANFVRDVQIITLYKMHMRLLLVNFAALAAIALLQIHCHAGDDVLKDKIVRATLNHSEPAVVKVGINGVTSLEFPYKIEAIDGYGFSQTPGSGDAFQISYTKGTNYFSVRALKPGVTGNLTVVLDQKVYSLFFEESNDPSFVNIFAAASLQWISSAWRAKGCARGQSCSAGPTCRVAREGERLCAAQSHSPRNAGWSAGC